MALSDLFRLLSQYLSGIGAGSCPVQRCCLIIVGLLLAGTGHQAVPPWGLPLPGTAAMVAAL